MFEQTNKETECFCMWCKKAENGETPVTPVDECGHRFWDNCFLTYGDKARAGNGAW